MLKIAQMGSNRSRKDNEVLQNMISDISTAFDFRINKQDIERMWFKGIEEYNRSNKNPISLEKLKRMMNTRSQYMNNFFDPDYYVKPYSLERNW